VRHKSHTIKQIDVRVVQAEWRHLIRMHLQTRPSPFYAKAPPSAEELLVRIVWLPRILADECPRRYTIREVGKFVVEKDELRAAVLEDVIDFFVREAGVHCHNDSTGSDYTLKCLCRQAVLC
jgi:hypothetical protein